MSLDKDDQTLLHYRVISTSTSNNVLQIAKKIFQNFFVYALVRLRQYILYNEIKTDIELSACYGLVSGITFMRSKSKDWKPI